MHGLATLVIDNLRAIGAEVHPLYEEMLSHAMAAAPPPFFQNWFGRRYFELARRSDWFANSLIANAALEGYGATQIWKFSNRVGNEAYAAAVRQHSLDESRHSSMFVAMMRILFPAAHIDDATARSLDDLQPKYSLRSHPAIEKCPPSEALSGEELLDELVQVHITEIRALVLQFLLRETLLAYSPPSVRRRIGNFSAVLIRDEARHIEYTARIFDAEASAGRRDFLFDAFENRLRGFNDLTMIELERERVTI